MAAKKVDDLAGDAGQPDEVEVDPLAELRAEVAELRARLDTMAPRSGAAHDNAARFRMSEGERLDRIERERENEPVARPANIPDGRYVTD